MGDTQGMGLGTVFAGLVEKIKNLAEGCAEFIKSHSRIVIIAASACMVILLLLLVLALVSGRTTEAAPPQPALSDLSADPGPVEDFFLPYEPDFVPGILLEREPKDGWTEEDARPFWTDPLQGNEDAWRKRIESGIDAMLEHVP